MHQGLVGQTIGVGYRIDAELSGGNMGMVYQATQLSVERRVAIKVIDQDRALNSRSVDRFFHEARIISRLEHPHIVRLYDFGRDQAHDLLYLVMEYIDGPTLNELLRTHRFKQQLVVEIGIQICRALIESHAQKVVHRDLKPANILLSRMSDGSLQLKVVDFGVARAVENLDKQLTAEGAICGTPRYMPPEQARHGGNIDGRADLYALGLILYEMLCGYPPFDAEDAIELIFKHIKEEPRPLSTFLRPHELDRELETLTHELLYKAPSKRPDDALAVLRRLEQIRAKLPGASAPIRLDGHSNIYTQLGPWMLPAVQEARAALVFGNTSQLGSEELDMEPLETEWDHTHTVRVDINSIVNQETKPFKALDPVPPLAWGAGPDEATIPPEEFVEQPTQLTSSGFYPRPQRVTPAPPAELAELDPAHLSTLVEEDGDVEPGPTHIAHLPASPTLAEPPLELAETLPPERPPGPPRVKMPSRNKTLSDTLQALFFRFGGARPKPEAIAENTAENMFLNSSEEELAELEAQHAAERATTERLLVPVMLVVVLCVAGVIAFVLWRAEQQDQLEPTEEVSRLEEPVAGVDDPQIDRPDEAPESIDEPVEPPQVLDEQDLPPHEEEVGLRFDEPDLIEEVSDVPSEPDEVVQQDEPARSEDDRNSDRKKRRGDKRSPDKKNSDKKRATQPGSTPEKERTDDLEWLGKH